MVVQVLTDSGKVVHHLDADVAKVRSGSDAGQQQQLRGVDRPTGEDNLAVDVRDLLLAAVQVGHPDRASPLDQHP
jgi:hypothetical protein